MSENGPIAVYRRWIRDWAGTYPPPPNVAFFAGWDAALARRAPSGEAEAVIWASRKRRAAYAEYCRVQEANGPFTMPPEAEWQVYLAAVAEEDAALDRLNAARPEPESPAPPAGTEGEVARLREALEALINQHERMAYAFLGQHWIHSVWAKGALLKARQALARHAPSGEGEAGWVPHDFRRLLEEIEDHESDIVGRYVAVITYRNAKKSLLALAAARPESEPARRITPDQYLDLSPEQEARFLEDWGPGTQGHEALMYLADKERHPLSDPAPTSPLCVCDHTLEWHDGKGKPCHSYGCSCESYPGGIMHPAPTPPAGTEGEGPAVCRWCGHPSLSHHGPAGGLAPCHDPGCLCDEYVPCLNYAPLANAEGEDLRPLLRELFEYTTELEKVTHVARAGRPYMPGLPGTDESRVDLGDRVRQALAGEPS